MENLILSPETSTKFAHFDRNENGRDFVVGDLHGMFGMLAARLGEVRFDTDRDRLFSVGDLVDRGPASRDALTWLNQPWFFAVRGNHEQMALDFTAGDLDARSYATNGGSWFLDLPEESRPRYLEWFAKLPLAMEIDTAAGLFGIVHADCPFADWDHLRASLVDAGDAAAAEACLWSRERISTGRTSQISNVAAVLVGHTPVKMPQRLGNVLYLDTGAVYRGGRLTVVELGQGLL